MFNIDLLKIFDYTDVMFCKKGEKKASEFLENDEYYKENYNKYKNQGWKRTTDKNLIIPNIFKLWADVVQEQLPQLKKLNPRAQNLQIFEEQTRIIKENGVKKELKETIKYEIYECYLKKTIVKKNIAIIIGEYISKYEAGLSDKEITKMIKQKQQNKINRNLFQFSRSCKKCVVEKTIKYLPYDFQHPQYQLISFYHKNILDFNKNHPLFSLLRNSILKQNKKKVCYKENTKEALDFEKNIKQYIIKFKQNKGRLSFSYIKGFYSLNMYNNYLKSPKYIQTLNLLQKMFFIKQLQTKEPLTDFELEHNIKFTQFNNLISPLEVRLRN
jgi:hypothetical protein